MSSLAALAMLASFHLRLISSHKQNEATRFMLIYAAALKSLAPEEDCSTLVLHKVPEYYPLFFFFTCWSEDTVVKMKRLIVFLIHVGFLKFKLHLDNVTGSWFFCCFFCFKMPSDTIENTRQNMWHKQLLFLIYIVFFFSLPSLFLSLEAKIEIIITLWLIAQPCSPGGSSS